MADSALPFDGSGLSIVVPIYNEGPIITAVLTELRTCLPQAEIVAVDDGSDDETWDRIRALPSVRGLRLLRHCGQSAAIYWGLNSATKSLLGIMDGDGQNDPADFGTLVRALGDGRADVACGFRVNRHDSWNRRIASRFANVIRRLILRDGVRDTGCSQKVFMREHGQLLVPFRGMHRYLPAIFRRAGLRVIEVPVNHRPRLGGASKYDNWQRARAGICDLFGVAWLLNRKVLPPPTEAAP